jgi:hypothetical protein
MVSWLRIFSKKKKDSFRGAELLEENECANCFEKVHGKNGQDWFYLPSGSKVCKRCDLELTSGNPKTVEKARQRREKALHGRRIKTTSPSKPGNIGGARGIHQVEPGSKQEHDLNNNWCPHCEKRTVVKEADYFDDNGDEIRKWRCTNPDCE